jgi:hypothetical protein
MRRIKLLITLTLLLAVFPVPALVFFNRAPVLVVTDVPFVALYGEKRLRQQQIAVSITLFRLVKPVLVADGASPDILVFSITEAASRPFCVLFPRGQAQAASRYHVQFPEIPVALIGGVAPVSELPSPEDFFCVYSTDRETDLYREGLLAGLLGSGGTRPGPAEKPDQLSDQKPDTQGVYAFWQDRYVQAAERAFFSRWVEEEDTGAAVIFATYASQIPDAGKIACAVLTGAGAAYFDNNPTMPVILFSWMDPAFTASEVAVIFDDSPWAMAVPAARMALSGQVSGKIPSNPLILREKISDNNLFQILKKSAKKVP